MKNIFTSLLIVGILASCTKNYYVNPNFDAKTKNHTTVAILPFKMINTGKQPKNLSQEDLIKLEEGESQAFQISLYNQLLKSTRGGKKPFSVEFQSFDITNAKLKERGMTLKDTWDKNPADLAKILQVDAVVKTSVQKNRYLSDLASYGIDIGTQVLESLTGIWGAVPGNLSKTNDVKVSCSLINSEDASTLYSLSRDMEIDWSTSTTEVIEFINRRISKTFPYRIEK